MAGYGRYPHAGIRVQNIHNNIITGDYVDEQEKQELRLHDMSVFGMPASPDTRVDLRKQDSEKKFGETRRVRELFRALIR